MNIAIIVFSPSGNSLATAGLIEKSFSSKGAKVQIVDLTARKELAEKRSITEYLNTVVDPHDLLFIGGPIYVGHIQENVKNIIKALPLPDKKWSPLVIPFVSYGGVHSSIALKEAGRLLKKRNRTIISGLKIASTHSLTKNFDFQINENKPGKEEIQLIDSLADKVIDLIQNKPDEIKDVSSSFAYASFGENLLYNLLSEKLAHKVMFGGRIFIHENCTGCGLCAKKCPVQIIEMVNKKPVIQKQDKARCCYCAECFYNCKFNAVSYDLTKSKKYLGDIHDNAKFESPQSAIF